MSMKLETIIQAALNDMERGKVEPHCGEPAHSNDIDYCEGYAEPGYDDPVRCVLFANWNGYPSRLIGILERAGYAVEWSDEWSTCGDCYKAIRTQQDSYGWRKYFVIYDDCEIICANCVKHDLDAYEKHLLNRSTHADTFDVDWESQGFTKFNNDRYESGFHPGQNDNPKVIVKQIPANHDFLFTIPSVGQFDISFDCWIRPIEDNEND